MFDIRLERENVFVVGNQPCTIKKLHKSHYLVVSTLERAAKAASSASHGHPMQIAKETDQPCL
jgi:hypothetical protein